MATGTLHATLCAWYFPALLACARAGNAAANLSPDDQAHIEEVARDEAIRVRVQDIVSHPKTWLDLVNAPLTLLLLGSLVPFGYGIVHSHRQQRKENLQTWMELEHRLDFIRNQIARLSPKDQVWSSTNASDALRASADNVFHHISYAVDGIHGHGASLYRPLFRSFTDDALISLMAICRGDDSRPGASKMPIKALEEAWLEVVQHIGSEKLAVLDKSVGEALDIVRQRWWLGLLKRGTPQAS